MNAIEPDEYCDHEKVIPRWPPDQGALQAEIESLKQQLAFGEAIHKVAVRQRDTAWATLNDREARVDDLTRALENARREISIWSLRYQDLAAEMANVVALRAPAPILIPRPPGDGAFDLALDRIADMLKGDDGQAWKEAEKFLARHRPQEVSR